MNKNNILRVFWLLRYRLYAICAILVCIPVLYASSNNVSPNIIASGYKVTESNILAQKLERNIIKIPTTTTSTQTSKTSSSTVKAEKVKYDFTSVDISRRLKEVGFDTGYINAQTIRDLKLTFPIKERIEEIDKVRSENEDKAVGPSLNSLFPKPDNPSRSNFVSIPNYKINAPIVYASFDDVYERSANGEIDFFKPRDTSDVKSPYQVKLQEGVVCDPRSPFPGDIGNSYCVGHSSNYSFIKSNYNEVFKPIMQKGKIGEEIIIFDPYGRELKFRIFETLSIEEKEVEKAYKRFDNRRVLTLQTSIVTYRLEKGWYPYQRWLVRGELMCANDQPC
jgi:sortase (surface protein transpeptidase)